MLTKSFREQPSLSIGYTVAQILVHPLGRAWASAFPDCKIGYGRFSFRLNPGPWNMKEHGLIALVSRHWRAFIEARTVLIILPCDARPHPYAVRQPHRKQCIRRGQSRRHDNLPVLGPQAGFRSGIRRSVHPHDPDARLRTGRPRTPDHRLSRSYDLALGSAVDRSIPGSPRTGRARFVQWLADLAVPLLLRCHSRLVRVVLVR